MTRMALSRNTVNTAVVNAADAREATNRLIRLQPPERLFPLAERPANRSRGTISGARTEMGSKKRDEAENSLERTL